MWTISHIACNAIEKLNIFGYNDAEFENNNDPSAHMEITVAKRLTRSSDFEKGYEEFLRNYHHDNNIGPNHDQGGHYRVIESDENASYGNANDEVSADDDDDEEDDESGDGSGDGSESGEPAEINEGYVEYDSGSGSESVESNEKRKSYKAKPQSKSQGRPAKKLENDKHKHKKIEKKTKPKKKKCKTEKRNNMLCTICYNPTTDEKSESCSYSSEPKEHNYAYTEDSSFGGNKDKEPESLEASNSSENDNESEGQTIKPERKNPPSNKYPVYNSRKPKQAPKYSPSPRPHTNRNYGPQTFDVPQTFRITHSRGRPSSRYQTKKPSPNVTLLRYRTVENPFTSERIRLIVPTAPQNHPKQQPTFQNNRLPPVSPDVRPPRDVNSAAQTESILSNVTKEHDFEYLPSHLNDEASRHSIIFTNKDGLKCKKSIDGNKVCFECFVDGERRKECMFSKTHKPTHFFESYTTSKKSKHSLGSLNPLNYDSISEPKPKPKPKHSHIQNKNKLKSHSIKQNKTKKHVKIEEPSSISPLSEELVFANVEKLPAETEAEWSLNPKIKPKQPETEIEWSSNQNNKQKQLDTEVEWNANQNNKQKPIKSQPLRAAPEVIYGTPQSESESYTIFYEPKPIQFIADTSSRTIHI